MVKRKFSEQFWIANISNMNVSLGDLGLTVPARRSMNLLDNRHHSFNKEQLLASAATGSLFKKRDKIVIRKVAPIIETRQIVEVDHNATVPSRRRSVVQIEEIHYEELDVTDDVFAAEAADFTDQDYKK